MTNCIAPPSRIHFAEFACDDALGIMLAHTLTAGSRKLRKGRVLDADDIAALKLAGIATVSGARLNADDVAENDAAAGIAALLAGDRTEARRPNAGRCNLHATAHGVCVLDPESIIRANAIDEAVAIGTLPPWTVVRKGQVVATVKIIPFGVQRHVMETCRTTLAIPPVRIAPLRPHRAALIETGREITIDATGRNNSATALATRQRLQNLGSRLALELNCPHDPDAIADHLRQAQAAGCDLILISGATSTKDRHDIAPTGIVRAGGEIRRFGLPVEPGNMLLLGQLDDIPIIVLPGCARSRRLNGLDWILHRLLAKLPLDHATFAAMGIGGLIRSTPEESDDPGKTVVEPHTVDADRGTNVAALILAAGRSSRMGTTHKLLETIDGIPIVQRAANAACASRAASVTVVTGHEADAIEALVTRPRITIARNPDYTRGMSSSLRCGIEALPPGSDGVLVMLADMPRIDAHHLDQLIEAFQEQPTHIIVPMYEGRRGNPVLWPREYFDEIRALEGDRGAQSLLAGHADRVVPVEIDDEAIFLDVDTPQDLNEQQRN